MERNINTAAVVIGTQKLGEINRSVTLLSPSLGIIRATVYGGQKSRKALRPPLFSIGTFYLLANPANHSYSLTDVALLDSCPFDFPLESVGIASLAVELSQRIGESDARQVFSLLSDFLMTLSQCESPTDNARCCIQFIWQLLKIAGLNGDLDICPVCEREYTKDEILYFSSKLNFFCCDKCADVHSIILGPGARRYLHLTQNMSFYEAFAVNLNESTAQRIKKTMVNCVNLICDKQLRTVSSGMV